MSAGSLSVEPVEQVLCYGTPRSPLPPSASLAEQAEERGLTTGVHPAGFAAACLYKAGREEGRWLTQSDVAESGNVTPTTVRTHHQTLEEQVA